MIIKRWDYDLRYASEWDHRESVHMDEAKEGDYVLHSDHVDAMADLVKVWRDVSDANQELYETELLRNTELQAKCYRMQEALIAVMEEIGTRELNMGNYTDDEVSALNAAASSSYLVAKKAIDGDYP